jgi:hypothetical protein
MRRPTSMVDVSRKGSETFFSVRVATKADLEHIAALDAHEYRASSIDAPGLAEWFKKYHRGTFVLEHRPCKEQRRIVGALGIWPITGDAFRKVTGGQLAERDMTGRHIMPFNKDARYRYWYVADVIVEARLRRTHNAAPRSAGPLNRSSRALITLLDEGIRQWLKSERVGREIELCAIAAGKYGGSLLERFGFERVVSGSGVSVACPNGHVVYKLTTSRDRLATVVEEYMVRLQRRRTA